MSKSIELRIKKAEEYALAALKKIKDGGLADGQTGLPITAANITENSTHRFVTDNEKLNWNNKLSPVSSQDIEITDSTKGIIWKTPDGSRWRITLDNTGHLVSTKL